MPVIPVAVALVASAVAVLCAAMDGALLAADEPGARPVAPVGASLERTHRTLGVARLAAYVVAGAALAVAMERVAPMAAVVAWLAAALLLVALAESGARVVGLARGGATVRHLRPWVRPLEWLVAPAGALAARLDRVLRGAPPAPTEDDATVDLFRQVVAPRVEVPDQPGRQPPDVFMLGETEVREIMIPRVEIVAIERETPWSEVVDRVRSSEHARLPVYDGTLDEVLGILNAKDLLPAVLADEPPPGGWVALLRPAAFIPLTKRLDAQLRDFNATGAHLAIVVDEYGGTAGLVTVEDIVEEIVGEIQDEYDEEEADVEREGASRFWVTGRLTLDDLSELLDHDFQRADVTTVGGLVYDLFGRVPRAGDTMAVDGFRIVVERVVRRRVVRVYFERVASFAAQESE